MLFDYMDRRGDTSIMFDSIIHILIFILFFSAMFWFVNSYFNGAAYLEDFYSKEIVQAINSAKAGQEIKLDITKLANVAIKEGKPVEDIIFIDNVNNLVVASARINTGTSFEFFNDVDIVDWGVKNPSGESISTRFIFKVKEKQK